MTQGTYIQTRVYISSKNEKQYEIDIYKDKTTLRYYYRGTDDELMVLKSGSLYDGSIVLLPGKEESKQNDI